MADDADWSEVACRTVGRDPRKHPYGYLVSSELPLGTLQSFVWFESVEELVQYLGTVEPRISDVNPGSGLEDYQGRVRPLLEAAQRQGLAAELRVAVNGACPREFRVLWWGTFADLCAGEGEFARGLVDAYLGKELAGQPVPPDKINDFVEYVQVYGA